LKAQRYINLSQAISAKKSQSHFVVSFQVGKPVCEFSRLADTSAVERYDFVTDVNSGILCGRSGKHADDTEFSVAIESLQSKVGFPLSVFGAKFKSRVQQEPFPIDRCCAVDMVFEDLPVIPIPQTLSATMWWPYVKNWNPGWNAYVDSRKDDVWIDPTLKK